MSLPTRLAFFDGTGPGDGRLTVGGVWLTERALLDSTISSYRGPAAASGGGLHLLPKETERGMWSGLPQVNRKNPCVIECLHVMWQLVVPRRQEGSTQGGDTQDGKKKCDMDRHVGKYDRDPSHQGDLRDRGVGKVWKVHLKARRY